MGGTYGTSFASKLIREGRYEEAVAEAGRAFDADPGDPEPLVERAAALACLERHEEAAADLVRALEIDREASVLDVDAVDDAYFSSVLALARSAAADDVEKGVSLLAGYRRVLPEGQHLRDLDDWTRRLRGGDRGMIVKERD